MTLALTPSYFRPMPPASKPLTEIAEKLRAYVARSQKTQRKLAEEAGIPDPSYLSHMVNGRVNWVESEYFRPLTVALSLAIEEIRELNPDIVVSEAVEQPVKTAESDYEITDDLQAFIDEYGGKFKELLEPRWQRWLAQTDFRDDPQSPEDWLDTFLYFRQKVNPR